MESFKALVSEYISVSQKIQVISKDVKTYTTKKKELNDQIVEYMIENKVEACKLENNNALLLKTTSHFESLKPEFIQTTLQEFFESGKVKSLNPAQEATTHIMSQREESTRHSLRIVKGK